MATRRRHRLALGLAVMLVLGLTPGGAAAAAEPPPQPSTAGVTVPMATVTLVTGDRVTVMPTANGRQAASVRAARWPGRRVDFRTTYADGELRVIPSDVARLVPDVLDPALFDVSALIRSGYHDAASRTLPLIVRHAPGARLAGSRAGGLVGPLAGGPLRAVRELPSIDATAMELSKAEAATVGEQLAGASTSDLAATTGVSQLWLDGTVRGDALDHNLTQIGAPAAWNAGLSGAGVRVAVLDTGVDSGHPDLVGRVASEANFTDSPVTGDRNGHGSHVASLVAGSGAAAGGARKGVAFEASLLSGKVLGDGGVGQLSWIIAGMEWATAQGARVVNMSLGSDGASTGLDPLSVAVNELSTATGALFVTSAGNSGPGPTTIGAPGAADTALTVGAVDGRDAVATFSSRGPRLGNYAIKPDLVAPGVSIIAARAAGTSLGNPTGPRYTRLSGTSMAAPQVAGTAALLAQQRPEWTGPMLKAVLMGTAAATPGGVFDRGAGRLDLSTAIRQRLVATTPALSYGLVSYPQGGLPPVAKPVTLANPTGSAVTVDLTAALRGPAGHPAPAGMVGVSPARLAIPAGGTGTATVTVAVALGGFGAFSGEVTATAPGGPALRVPIGVVKESTRHLLRVRGLDRNGTGAVETLVTVINLQDVSASPEPGFMAGGEATVRVVPGFYAITAAIPTLEEGEPPPDSLGSTDLVVGSVSIATIADQHVDRDLDVVLDARTARPISATVRGVDTTPTDVHLFVAVQDRAKRGFVLGYDTSPEDVVAGRLFVAPTEPVRHGRLEASSKWRLATVGDGPTPTYDLLFAANRFPRSLAYVVDRTEAARLGTVDTLYRAPGVPVSYREFRQVFTDINPVSVAISHDVPGTAPLSRVEHVSSGANQLWFQCVTVVSPLRGGIGDFCQAPGRVRPHARVPHAWLTAPLRTTAAAFRTASTLFVGMNDLGEAGPHSGSMASHVFARRTFQLHRDGVLIAEGTDPLGGHAVPADRAVFRLTRTVELSDGLLPLSTVVESAWTFASAPPRRTQPPVMVPSVEPPLLDVAVAVPVNALNQVSPGAPLVIELTVSHQVAKAPRVTEVSLRVSTDDGQAWTAVSLRRVGPDRYRAVLAAGTLPTGAAVSLRTVARDRDGNQFEQTIVRAFTVG